MFFLREGRLDLDSDENQDFTDQSAYTQQSPNSDDDKPFVVRAAHAQDDSLRCIDHSGLWQ